MEAKIADHVWTVREPLKAAQIARISSRIGSMPERRINITQISVSTGPSRTIKLRIEDKNVDIPVDAELHAYFKSHFVRDKPSVKQREEYATIMRLMVAAYKQGTKDGGSPTP